jgi:L-fuconolactonase
MRIDAHQHFWDRRQPFDYRWLDAPESAAIKGNRMPDDLAPLLKAAGIDGSVLVQTQHDPMENRWALDLAARHPFILGVVGWVDLQAADAGDRLAEWRKDRKFVGVRHLIQDEAQDDFALRPAFVAGLKELAKQGLAFDLLVQLRHLKHAATLADKVPELTIILDHLGKPRVKARGWDDWRPHLQAAAARPNVLCKLSGLATEADWKAWKPADLRPYFEEALALFTPARCLFGSDWPVCELAGDYARIHAAFNESIAKLTPAEQALVRGDTARKAYKVPG